MENFVDFAETAMLVGVSIDSLREWMRKNKFPRPTHRRGTKRYWLRSEVMEAVEKLTLPVRVTNQHPGAGGRD